MAPRGRSRGRPEFYKRALLQVALCGTQPAVGSEEVINKGIRTGLTFGIASGVVTTVGLIAGLSAGTQSLAAVLGGILVIAVADSASDALGIHLAQEADPAATTEHVWLATVSTLLAKLLMATSFAVPLLLLPLPVAVMVSIGWGMVVLSAVSVWLARSQGSPVLPAVLEHLAIAVVVVVISHVLGVWVRNNFG